MSKNTRRNKTKKDTLSEQAFTVGLMGCSTLPEVDSPSGSDVEEETEFLLGLSYEPNDQDSQENKKTDLEADLS